MSHTIPRNLQQLLLFTAIAMGPAVARAQGPASYASAGVAVSVSASGVTTFGFAPPERDAHVSPFDVSAMLPAGSDIPSVARPVVEQMWRGSATFRRQCARLKAASVAVVLTLDYPADNPVANAETQIRRRSGLRAHIRLRGADRRTVELPAHEIEHVLEQVDDVDLAVAVADGVHGAHVVRKPAAFETRRAVVAGRQVAREVEVGQERR